MLLNILQHGAYVYTIKHESNYEVFDHYKAVPENGWLLCYLLPEAYIIE